MQLRVVPASIIYIGSYLPLSAILMVQDFDADAVKKPLCQVSEGFLPSCHIPLSHPIVAILFLSLCFVCFLFTFFALRLAKTKYKIKIVESKHVPSDIINYVIPYIVSFMSLDYKETIKLIGFCVFLAWMFWIIYRSGQIIMNPILIAFGWGLYEVKYSHEGSENIYVGRILSKEGIIVNGLYKKADIQDVMITHHIEDGGNSNG